MKIDLSTEILYELEKLKREYRVETYSETIKILIHQRMAYIQSIRSNDNYVKGLIKNLQEVEDKAKNKDIHLYHHFEK